MEQLTDPTALWARVDEAAAHVRQAVGDIDVAAILGSGLGAFADALEDAQALDYGEVPHFAQSTVAGHAGRFVRGQVAGSALRVGVFQGRFHHYEGWSAEQIVLPARVAAALGAKVLIVTNAAGSVNGDFPPGRLMVIRDHINNLGFNPLRGVNDDARGPRFPSLNDAYPARLRQLAHEVAAAQGTPLAEGVYMANPGPSYESPAEVQMMARLGADAIGMSTVPEVIAATHLGLPVLGISCLTNWGAGLTETPPTHDEVIETGREAAARFVQLVAGVIAALPADPSAA